MGRLTIVGTGLEIGNLTFAAAELLQSGAKVILHTDRIGCAEWLREKGIEFTSLDSLYETCPDFDEHAKAVAETVIAAAETEDVVYAVYDIRDRSAQRIMAARKKTDVVAGPPTEGALFALAEGSTRMLEASDWENFKLSASDHALIREIDSRALASEVKLKLMETYPEESTAYLLSGDGTVARLPLFDLDRYKKYDHRTCALVRAEGDVTKLERFGFDDLVRIMERLQAPDGCSWDRVQTHASLRACMLEETYEVIEAIDAEDTEHLYDELGDLMMNIVMQAVIAKKHGEFEIGDCLTAICRKMISRHSHIFGNDTAGDPDTVMDLWTRNKMKERGQENYTQVLREVSKALPALMRAEKVAKKAAGSGVEGVLPEGGAVRIGQKVYAEINEESLGDMLFEISVMAQKRGIDQEIALNQAADRFIERFEIAEIDKNALK